MTQEPAAVVCENCGAPGRWTRIYDGKEVPLCLDCASLRIQSHWRYPFHRMAWAARVLWRRVRVAIVSK